MDLSFSTEQENFRKEVRNFLRDNLKPNISSKMKLGILLSKDEIESWHNTLNKKGWLAGSWPKKYGGQGWGVIESFIFEEECSAVGAPRILPFAFNMLAPVLMAFGSDKQRDYWLPRMLNGDDWWCQGYSEPGSGSDLASLKTSASREGNHYIVNGQKTWTTLGQHANMIFCLVRTSTKGKPQEGISFLLIDMNSDGIEVRPLRTIDGEHEINEVFLTNVKVPIENLVGEENKGWTYAKYLLAHERTGIANVGLSKRRIGELKQLASETKKDGKPLIQDPIFAARVAKTEIDLANLEITNLRILSRAQAGGSPGPESSILKILGSEIGQEIDSLTRRALGRRATIHVPNILDYGYNGPNISPINAATAAGVYFNNRKTSIYGGSNEIQKNIISKAVLEL